LAPGLRSIPFERRATIYYRAVDDAVEVVRILYAGRDRDQVFSGS
jgi:toxin ParE1/3/4